MPWSYIPYEELRKYVKIEFSLRKRNVDENGDYTGYAMGKKYRAKDCTDHDFESRGLHGTADDNYICVDWEGEEENLYLMNSNEAAWIGGHNSTNIIMDIILCSNHSGEFEDDSIWEGHENYKDIGWGYKREDEPNCYPPE